MYTCCALVGAIKDSYIEFLFQTGKMYEDLSVDAMIL